MLDEDLGSEGSRRRGEPRGSGRGEQRPAGRSVDVYSGAVSYFYSNPLKAGLA